MRLSHFHPSYCCWALQAVHLSNGTRTHRGLPGYVVVNGCTSVQEDNDTHEGGRDQHLCIQTQPGKVQSDLFTKILPEWDKNITCLISSEHGQNEQMLVWGGTSVLTAQIQWVGTWRRRCSWPTLHTEAEHNQIQTILIQTMISADFTNREGRMSLKTGVFSPFCHWTLCSLHLCLPIKEKRIPMKPKENWKKWVKCEEVEEFRKYLHHEEDKMPCRRRCRADWWFLGRGKWEFRACTSHCTRLVCVALVPEGKQFVEKKQSKSLDY